MFHSTQYSTANFMALYTQSEVNYLFFFFQTVKVHAYLLHMKTGILKSTFWAV